MRKLLDDIIESYKAMKSPTRYSYCRGKGTKTYTLRRIIMLREELLELYKEVKDM